jgi:hypothetical protein
MHTLALVLVIILIFTITGIYMSPYWRSSAKLEYEKIRGVFGEPSAIRRSPGGEARWDRFNIDNPISSIVVMDLDKNNVMITAIMELDSKTVPMLRIVDTRIGYNAPNHYLTIIGDSLATILATYMFIGFYLTPQSTSDNIKYKYGMILQSADRMMTDNYSKLQSLKKTYNLRYNIR